MLECAVAVVRLYQFGLMKTPRAHPISGFPGVGSCMSSHQLLGSFMRAYRDADVPGPSIRNADTVAPEFETRRHAPVMLMVSPLFDVPRIDAVGDGIIRIDSVCPVGTRHTVAPQKAPANAGAVELIATMTIILHAVRNVFSPTTLNNSNR